MLAQPFMQSALLAGTAIALVSGLVGWYVVARAEVFAGDALGDVAFTGVLAAAAAGLSLRIGLFAATIAVALLLAALGGRAGAGDVTIGVVLTWVLGLGVLCLDLFDAGEAGGEGEIAARTLFGSIFSLGKGEALFTAAVCLGALLAMIAIARPLLFATLDPLVARVSGVPVRLLGAIFLVLLGVDAAVATKAVGAMLLLGLLAAPAGAARRITSNPRVGIALSIAIAVLAMWAGLAIAYEVPALPPGSAVVLVAAAIFLAAGSLTRRPRVRRRVRTRSLRSAGWRWSTGWRRSERLPRSERSLR